MKKGFTLIELLAVIVILAIIALIATPIVLNIIDDSENSAVIRSAEFYINAVENAIMKENMKLGGTLNPKECKIKESGNVLCDGKELVIEVDGERPTSGTIIYDNGKLVTAEIGFEGATIVQNVLGDYVNLEEDIICKAVTTATTGNVPIGKFLPGDEYMCKVNEETEYRFFVVSTDGDRVSLIMERNINNDGTEANNGKNSDSPDNGRYNLLAWASEVDYGCGTSTDDDCSLNDKGPITAINFVEKATESWTNIEKLNETYVDEGGRYGSIKLTGRARLPKESEVISNNKGTGKCTTTTVNGGYGSCPLWLANYLTLDASKWDTTGMKGAVNIKGQHGYWVLSSVGTNQAQSVYLYGVSGPNSVYLHTNRGIRPVITVSKSNIS